jgi:hypothetical protein
MELQQSLGIIKEALDESIRVGVCKNIEHASALIQAWQVLIKSLNDSQKSANSQPTNSVELKKAD